MTTQRLSNFTFRLLLAGVALALIAAASWISARRADHALRADLLLQARLVAQAVNPVRVAALAGTEADLASPDYWRLKEQLMAVGPANPKCKWIYLMGRKADGMVFFFVDSEAPDVADSSPPGQLYEESSEICRQVFVDRIAVVEGPVPDRWGVWVSALVPMIDPKTGSMIAVLGMDIEAQNWKWTVAWHAALTTAMTAITGLFALLAAGLQRSRRDLRARQKELQESEAQKKAILNGITTNIALVDKNLNILWANQAAASSVHKQAQDLVGRSCHSFWGDPAKPCEDCPTLQAFRTGKTAHKILQTPDGRIWDEGGEPVFDTAGNVAAVVEIAQDITGIKQAEAAQRESEKNYGRLIENSHDIIYTLDPNGAFTFVSPAWTALLGHPVDQVVGKSFQDFVHPDDVAACMAALQTMAQTGQRQTGVEYRVRHADGSWRRHTSSGVPLQDKSGKIIDFEGIAGDITERKQAEDRIRTLLAESNQARTALLGILEDQVRAEEEKAQLEDHLQQARKMDSIGRLAGGVAHDFNNMLTVILGRTEIALEQAAPDLPFRADLTEIHGAALRAADITRQLLAFARKQTVAPKILDLNQAVEDMLQMLQRLIGENITLAWKRKEHLWPVKVDPSQIDQILVNLCVNARDAIAGVGKIAIEAGNATFDEDYCADHAGFAPGEYAWLAISDNGCGMDWETLEHIFEPFFTTKGVGEGTGLGLATVYGIVQQNNGLIHAYSEPGRGSIFKIYLPRHGSAEAQSGQESPAEPAARGSEILLLVEDDPAIMGVTAKMLERQGYTVKAANSPSEAIRLAKEHAGAIHLLLTDVVMPEMNGRNLANHLLSGYPNLKLLFMSGYTADIIANNGVLEEGVNFIQKPFSRQDLTAKVREVLDSGKA